MGDSSTDINSWSKSTDCVTCIEVRYLQNSLTIYYDILKHDNF